MWLNDPDPQVILSGKIDKLSLRSMLDASMLDLNDIDPSIIDSVVNNLKKVIKEREKTVVGIDYTNYTAGDWVCPKVIINYSNGSKREITQGMVANSPWPVRAFGIFNFTEILEWLKKSSTPRDKTPRVNDKPAVVAYLCTYYPKEGADYGRLTGTGVGDYDEDEETRPKNCALLVNEDNEYSIAYDDLDVIEKLIGYSSNIPFELGVNNVPSYEGWPRVYCAHYLNSSDINTLNALLGSKVEHSWSKTNGASSFTRSYWVKGDASCLSDYLFISDRNVKDDLYIRTEDMEKIYNSLPIVYSIGGETGISTDYLLVEKMLEK